MSEAINKKRVGILRGGDTDYYEKSLQEGGELILYIRENLADHWQPVDILIDRNGVWHLNGFPIKPMELANRVDVVWNAAHPSFSLVLDNLFIPNVGVSSFAGALAENRSMLVKHLSEIGIKMPRHFVIEAYQKDFDGLRERYSIKKAKEVHEKFSPPWIIRSFNHTSDSGVHVAQTFPELVDAIEDITARGESILVEELISGKNAFLHTVSGFRGNLSAQTGEVYAFPVGNFSSPEKEKLTGLAKDLHKHFNISHYLKSNFVVHQKRGIFLTSVEFSPDIKEGSNFERVCESVGTKAHHVIEHMLEQVLV